MREFQYETCCIESTAELINDMIDSATKVTLDTILRHCRGIEEWAEGHGYGRWLPLERDLYVGYYRGRFLGVRCYYVDWSGIEFIWTRREA
ncbi:MAG: hypothetical protein ABSH28_05170 [Acidobacteriota bacterium]|jgi:hypothetical protein